MCCQPVNNSLQRCCCTCSSPRLLQARVYHSKQFLLAVPLSSQTVCTLQWLFPSQARIAVQISLRNPQGCCTQVRCTHVPTGFKRQGENEMKVCNGKNNELSDDVCWAIVTFCTWKLILKKSLMNTLVKQKLPPLTSLSKAQSISKINNNKKVTIDVFNESIRI